MEALDKHLLRPIKEVIAEFPAIADILNGYDIACVSCMVGTCLFKDIVSIHNLTPEGERDMMSRIASVISPDSGGRATQPAAATPKKVAAITYSPPIRRLVEEHILIKKWLAIIPDFIKKMDISTESGIKDLVEGIDFIRSYADRFHHGKEEDILFKHFDENSDVIQAMRSDHETGRRHVKSIMEALEKKDVKEIALHLQAYRELLTFHIKREDEILFPWIDRNLSEADKEKISSHFCKADIAAGQNLQEKYEKIISNLERKII